MSPELFIFPLSVFLFVSIIFLSKNPVYSVLALIIVLLHLSLLLIALGLEVLGYVVAIVYIGAIIVLFVFVIMMFYVFHFFDPLNIPRGIIEFYILGFVTSHLAYFIGFAFVDYPEYTNILYNTNLLHSVALYLFNDEYLLTIVVTLMMLIAVIGAITLTVKTNIFSMNPIIFIRKLINDILKKFK